MLTQADIDNLPDLNDTEIGSLSPLNGTLESFERVSALSNEDYHRGDMEFFEVPAKNYLSSSLLKNCITPTHIKQYISEKREPTKFTTRGTAMHTVVLEPEKFEYVLFDDSQKIIEIGGANPRATNKYKEWKAEFEEVNKGKAILPKEDFKALWTASKRLDRCDFLKTLLKKAFNEQSFFAKFIIKGNEVYIKIRPDAILVADNLNELGINDGDIINISVKTTREASPEKFKYEFFKHDYHISESLYHDVLSEIFPEVKIHTIIVSIEPETGLFMCHKLTEDTIEKGRLSYKPLLENWMNTDLKKVLSQEIPIGYEILNGSFIVEL